MTNRIGGRNRVLDRNIGGRETGCYSSETGACFLEIVLLAVRGMCDTVEQGGFRNELLYCFQYGRCALNSPLYVILGIGEQQLVEGRLIDPLSHR